jgi:TolA-binding protein
LVQDYPDHERAPDALYQIGETFGSDEPDSASAAWEGVVSAYPDSRVAPRALYSLGLMYERLGDERAARLQYQRVVNGYPRSDEADLARTKLGSS